MVQPMHRQRSDASACSARGKVYVAGGFNGQEVLNSVEFYDPTVNEWNFTRPMSNPRSDFFENELLYLVLSSFH
jgi:hypothetical protein